MAIVTLPPLVQEYRILKKPTLSVAVARENNINNLYLAWDVVGNTKGYYLSIFKGDSLVYSLDSATLGENNNIYIYIISERRFINGEDLEKGGEYTISLRAIARSNEYEDSPEQFLSVVKLATPSVIKRINSDTRQVTLSISSLDEGVTFDVNNAKLKEYDYSEASANSVKEITFTPNSGAVNNLIETAIFAEKASTSRVFYISSEIVKDSTIALGAMENLKFKDNRTLTIPQYSEYKERVELKLYKGDLIDDVCLDIGQAEYPLKKLEGGQYTLKFRKVSEEVNTVPSTWNTLIFEKNSPAYDLIFEESTLKWKTGGGEHIRGYSLIKNGVESTTSLSVSGYNGVFGDIDNSSQISYSVVVLGDFTGTSFRGIPVLDSEPSESFVVARLNKPDI